MTKKQPRLVKLEIKAIAGTIISPKEVLNLAKMMLVEARDSSKQKRA